MFVYCLSYLRVIVGLARARQQNSEQCSFVSSRKQILYMKVCYAPLILSLTFTIHIFFVDMSYSQAILLNRISIFSVQVLTLEPKMKSFTKQFSPEVTGESVRITTRPQLPRSETCFSHDSFSLHSLE